MTNEFTTNYMALTSSEVKEHFPYQEVTPSNASVTVTVSEKAPGPTPHIGPVKLNIPKANKKK